MRPTRFIHALLGLIGIQVHAPINATLPLTRSENPIVNSIRFGSHFRTNGPPPASYNRRNQRKIRKNFRRAIAAGL